MVKDATFKLDASESVHVDKVKIVACNYKKPGDV